MILGAIFDFDETMVQLEDLHGTASATLAREMGDDYARLPESFRERSGHRVIDDVAEMKSFFGWGADLDALYVRRQELFDDECARANIELLPGVERVVRDLARRRLALGVASSGTGESIRRILQRLGLAEFFAAVVAGEDVRHGKPHPEPYQLAASRIGVAPDKCVVFEDSSVGVRSAKSAGCVVVGVRNPYAATRQDLEVADLVVEGMDAPELQPFLSGLVDG